MIAAAILVCEVTFWVFLAGGLVARYVLRRPTLGMVLLLGSPAADLALLMFTAVDLSRGASPTTTHALAAAYLGATVAFGHDVVRWADRRFAAWYAREGSPAKPRRDGPERVRHEWREFRKAVVFWVVAVSLELILAGIVGDVQDAAPLLGYTGVLTMVLVIWFLAGPVATSIAVRFPGRADRSL
jgi:hypothetical protein